MMLVFKLRANLLILPIIYTYLRNRILLSLRQQLIVEVFFFVAKHMLSTIQMTLH